MKLLITLSLILFLTSCTITKRHFGPGYHVEWKSSFSSKRPNSERLTIDSNLVVEAKSLELSEILQSEMDDTSASITIEEQIPVEQNMSYSGELKQDRLTDLDKSVTSFEVDHIAQSIEVQKEDGPEANPKKMEKNTWISLLFLLLLGIMTAIFSISGFLLTVGAGAILFGLALGMFITSLIAVIRIMRNPERYKNRVLSFTVFFFSCTFLAIGLIAFVAIGLSEINFF